MNEPTTDNLVKRLERLEQENRRLKLIGAVVLAGIVALVTMGPASCNLSQIGSGKVAKVIEAEQFILKDTNGRKRAALAVVEPIRGDAGLLLYDENGKLRADFTVGQLGVGELSFFDNDAKSIVYLRSARDKDGEAAGLTLTANDLKSGKQFELDMYPGQYLGFTGKGGAALLRVDENNDGVSLRLNGKAGAAILSSDNDTGVSLNLNGKEGYSAVLGSTQLKKTTGTVEKRPESSLVLLNKDDKVVWSAPR